MRTTADAAEHPLVGRNSECEVLDRLLKAARGGESGVLVLRGEAGVGKTALLQRLAHQAHAWRVVRATGVESELELAYSSLHQVCAPLLGLLDRLPAPQREALSVVFGLSAGTAPDRFLVGLGTLSLFAEAAEESPLLCIVDDAQWLDAASAQILAFVARRLLAEPVAFVCAERTGVSDKVLPGLPEMELTGLADEDAWSLLLGNVKAPLDAAVGAQIIAESHGNPLALLELPRTLNAADLAGGFGLPAVRGVPARIEASYTERIHRLPLKSQLLVLTAAAEPLGSPVLLRNAAASLGVELAWADQAEAAGLLSLGSRVEFEHPLIRSAAYHSASVEDRHRVHLALADATDAQRDPDRRAWHLARAASAPDETVAHELERSADRAKGRGGVAAAAAFLQRSVELTVDPTLRAERALAAAEASVQAAAFEAAKAVLVVAEAASLDELKRARVHLMRGRIAATQSYGSAAAALLTAAQELRALDPELSRATFLQAWGSALAAGGLATETTLRDVSFAAASAADQPEDSSPPHLLLAGLCRVVTTGLAAAAPTLRQAVDGFRSSPTLLRWGVVAAEGALALWDIEAFSEIAARTVLRVREAGALGLLPTNLQGETLAAAWSGRFREATSMTVEAAAVGDATGVKISPYGEMLLAAYRGDAHGEALFETTIANAKKRGEGLGVQYAQWASAVLANSLGRYDEAMTLARQASQQAPELFIADWALVELVEAATRSGQQALASESASRFADHTRACETDWGLGVAARCQALVSHGAEADKLYDEAIARLKRTPLGPELARSYLLHGEWLRREGRRIDAREQLHRAHELFKRIGMTAFEERARRELVASGERTSTRRTDMGEQLTPQEMQIALMARDGLGNRDIGARLFLSPRTIEWHMRHVFAKLGITSRNQLAGALPDVVPLAVS